MLRQVQVRSVCTRRASHRSVRRHRAGAEPQGTEGAMRTARGRFEGWGEGEEPSASSLAPFLNFSVLHLLSPGCGLLNHRPQNRGSRESRAGAVKREAERREVSAASRRAVHYAR